MRHLHDFLAAIDKVNHNLATAKRHWAEKCRQEKKNPPCPHAGQ